MYKWLVYDERRWVNDTLRYDVCYAHTYKEALGYCKGHHLAKIGPFSGIIESPAGICMRVMKTSQDQLRQKHVLTRYSDSDIREAVSSQNFVEMENAK